MAVFQYRAVDSAGKLTEGIMEAEAERGVVSRLHEMGFVPLGIAPSGGVARRRAESPAAFFKRRKITEKDLLYFTQELRTLVGAGLPLDRSLSVLANLVQGEEMKRTSRSLLEGVRAGRPLSSAMAEEPDIFPKVYVNMIRAGESSGGDRLCNCSTRYPASGRPRRSSRSCPERDWRNRRRPRRPRCNRSSSWAGND